MFKFCIKSFLITRVIYISFIIGVFHSNFISKYDLSPYIVSPTDNNETKDYSFLEKKMLQFLNHFSSYDAIMFVDIAKESHRNDSTFAFFPLFPYLIRGSANILKLFHFKNEYTPYLISGFILSNALCLINTILVSSLIFKLTTSTLRGKLAAILFLINPGTIFYISIYSENLCFTLQLLFVLIMISPSSHSSKFLPCSIIILFLVTTRSNGLFMCSFFVIPCLSAILLSKKHLNRLFDPESFRFNISTFFALLRNKIEVVGKYIILCFHAYLVFLWMTKFQPRQDICTKIKQGINKDTAKYSTFEQYCFHKSQSRIDNIYSYIQTEYWNVGFLKQISLNSIDRVLLSIPMNIVAAYIAYKAITYFDFPQLLFKFNLFKFLLKNQFYNEKKTKGTKIEVKEVSNPSYDDDVRLNSFILSGLIHLLLMMFVLICMAHPQINNRLLAGCPIIYYFLSEEMETFIKSGKIYMRGLLILIFYISFSFLSCIMQVGSYGFA